MTDQFWYSSKNTDEKTLILNSVIAFQDLDSERWVFDDKKDLYSFPDSDKHKFEDGFVHFGCYQDRCIVKASQNSGDLSSF